jgi:molybdopterin-containing oxidoreductase family molybdopterin binding subunit
MSIGNSDTVAETLKRIPFIISFDIFLNETTDFADIVLPDACYLERLDVGPNHPFIFNHPAGRGTWTWTVRQPVVPPAAERRDIAVLEVADRHPE